MILVDDHCHLNHAMLKDDLDGVLERARAAGVAAIIAAGVNPPTNREVLALAAKHAPLVRCSLGIHPVDAVTVPENDESGLTRPAEPFDVDKELAFIKSQRKNICAIGEVGLDYHWIKEEDLREKQRDIFRKIIALSKTINKPLILHTRKAEQDTIDILEEEGAKNVVLHCFTGKKKLIKRAADLGYYFSIPTLIDKLDQFKQLAEIVNINQLLTETDGPWLSPIPDEANEPKNVRLCIKHIARAKGLEEEEVARNIWLNFQRLFG